MVEDVVRSFGREQEIGPGGILVGAALEMAVGEFREHALVHRARLHQGRQFLNRIVRPVDAFEIPGLCQHGVAMRGLRLQGGGADQQGGGQQAAFHFFLEVNSTTP